MTHENEVRARRRAAAGTRVSAALAAIEEAHCYIGYAAEALCGVSGMAASGGGFKRSPSK